MPVGWNGSDPVGSVDATQYELGTEFLVNEDITITHVRCWADATEINLVGRQGRIWSTGGAELGVATMPTDLPTGWSVHELTTPVERTAGSRFIVSFGTGGNEGALTQGLNADVPSADAAVTALGFANATGTINGRFRVGLPGAFPNAGNANHAFYGADIQYTLGIGGNTAPEITALSLVDLDGTVTAVATVTDAESLVGASLRFDWGDFSADSVSNYPDVTESHTYAASGIYAVLVTITDSDGAVGYRAGAIEVTLPADEVDGVDVSLIMSATASYAEQIGALERVQLHEPKTSVPDGLSAALWFQSAVTVPQLSSLSKTAIRVEIVFRIFQNMLMEPADLIDPEITRVVNLMFNALHGGFTLAGLVTQVDVLGTYGAPLRCEAGYINQSGHLMRAMSIYIPYVIANAYSQER
jgi:hypothetical protein